MTERVRCVAAQATIGLSLAGAPDGRGVFPVQHGNSLPKAIDNVQSNQRQQWQRARAAQAAGDYLSAADAFAACAADPDCGAETALFEAAWCLELAGEPARALPLYERVVAESHDPALTLEAGFRLGWIALEQGDSAAAGPRLAGALDRAAAAGLSGRTVAHAAYWHAVCVESDGSLLDAAARYATIVAERDPELWHEAATRRLLCLSQVGDLAAAEIVAADLIAADAPVSDPLRLRTLQSIAREELAQIERARAAA